MTLEPNVETQPTSAPAKPILSPEERKEIVSNFCKAYLSGRLEVLPLRVGRSVSVTTGDPIPPHTIVERRRRFNTLIETACGIDNPQQNAIDSAIDQIFSDIIRWGGASLLEGEFPLTSNLDAKFRSLEERLEDLEKLIPQLIEEIRVLSRIRGPSSSG